MARYIRLPDKKIVFIRVPKVASSSIKFALLGKHLPGNEGEDKADRNVGDLFPDDFKFAVVRNPWDRLVSCYVDKIIYRGEIPETFPASCKTNMPFADFVKIVADTPDAKSDTHFRTQAAFIRPQNRLAVDFLMRFERLAEDWVRLRGILASLGHEVQTTLPVHQRREHRPYQEYYTSELVDIVAERYKPDTRFLGYEFDVNELPAALPNEQDQSHESSKAA